MYVRNSVMFVAVLGFASSMAYAADDPKKPADADINRLLIGKWEGADQATGITGTITYGKDGKFTADGMVPVGNKKLEVNTEGTWSVSGGTITYKVTKSSRPRVAPVGTEIKEVVNAIDEKNIRFTREQEKERVRTRTDK